MSQRMGGRFLVTAGLLALLWFILNKGDPMSWVVGGPAILVGALLASLLPPPPPWRISPSAALGFLPFFLWSSLLGAWDVTWRALKPRNAIEPGFFDYPLRLPAGPARVVFLSISTLIPGTLVAEVVGDKARVHALNVHEPHGDFLRKLESRVARVFRVPLGEAA